MGKYKELINKVKDPIIRWVIGDVDNRIYSLEDDKKWIIRYIIGTIITIILGAYLVLRK